MSHSLPANLADHPNVAARLVEMAARVPGAVSVVQQGPRTSAARHDYRRFSFQQLDQDSDRIVTGLRDLGVRPGMRLALLVRPSFNFISSVFALLKAGVVQILIDPGIGRRHMVDCLSEVEPDGFFAIPPAHAARIVLRHRFPKARFNVTVGRRWFWGGPTLSRFRRRPFPGTQLEHVGADDPAAIIFTSGSTGPPKGVLYTHGNFDHQVAQIRDHYAIRPGAVDLSCFPLFALFNCAMGVTTVIPHMDASRPAAVDPRNLVLASRDCRCTQSFASPAVWNVVGRHCEATGERLPTLKRVFSAGAPVPNHVLERITKCIAEGGEAFTPYGATEALPVASISASEVLGETAARSRQGAGTCVGGRFSEIQWRVIAISDEPIAMLADAPPLPSGQIGELIVSGPVVTERYVTRTEMNPLAKIVDGDAVWHRMGDVGYLDERDRFWFCGRKSQRVTTASGVMFTIPCEAIFNNHPAIHRSALVGVGPRGAQRPVIVAEPQPGQMPASSAGRQQLVAELLELGAGHELTRSIRDVLLHPSLPVDIRHNAKIFREHLAVWAAQQLGVARDERP